MADTHWLTAAVRLRFRRWLWDKYAAVYDELLHLTPYQNLLDLVCRYSVGDSSDGSDAGGLICELGSGTGNLLTRLAANSQSRIIGIEPSPEMIRRASIKIRPTGQVALMRADAVDGLRALLPASINTLVLSNVLYAISDRGQLWSQSARVLAPGGRIVICHSDRGGSSPIALEQLQLGGWTVFLRPRLYAVAAIDAIINLLAAEGEFTFTSFHELQAELRNAGFVVEFRTRCYGGQRRGVNFLATAER